MEEKKKKTMNEDLKERYGFSKANYKYIPAGGEILMYTGLELVYIEFKKNESGDWTNKVYPAIINEVSDYDPMTLTYNCKYQIVGEDQEKEVRIIPEGFSFNNADQEGWMCRFIPYSLHHRLMEDEAIHNKVLMLWSKKETMQVEGLKVLSDNKEQDKVLRYSCNIQAILKLSDNEIVNWRVQKLNLRHEFKDTYTLRIEDISGRPFTIRIREGQKEYEFKDQNKKVIGFLKLVNVTK